MITFLYLIDPELGLYGRRTLNWSQFFLQTLSFFVHRVAGSNLAYNIMYVAHGERGVGPQSGFQTYETGFQLTVSYEGQNLSLNSHV